MHTHTYIHTYKSFSFSFHSLSLLLALSLALSLALALCLVLALSLSLSRSLPRSLVISSSHSTHNTDPVAFCKRKDFFSGTCLQVLMEELGEAGML